MKCTKCGYESAGNFDKCPSCGNQAAAQSSVQTAASPQNAPQPQGVGTAYSPYAPSAASYYSAAPQKERSTGEKVAIGIAIAVAVLSVIAAFFIAIAFLSYESENGRLSSDQSEESLHEFEEFWENYNKYNDGDYGIDDYDLDDFDVEQFIKDYYGDSLTGGTEDADDSGDKHSRLNPAPQNTAVEFEDMVFSKSYKLATVTYDVSFEETYRGEAAEKLFNVKTEDVLEKSQSADDYEIFVVKYKVNLKSVDYLGESMDEGVKIVPKYDMVDSEDGSVSYDRINLLQYNGDDDYVKNGDTFTRWSAFLIPKEYESPFFMWYWPDNENFQSAQPAISDAAKVQAGEAGKAR